MRRSERFLVLLILILSVSLVLTLSVLLLERSVTAQGIDTTGVRTAHELQIVDKEGRVRIKLAVADNLAAIEILDGHGDVVWQAPPNEWLVDGTTRALEVYTGTGGNHWVQTVIQQGRIIILEDGSHWEVDPLNQNETVLWAPTSPITVAEADTSVGDFQYVLTNTEVDKSVRAKFQGQR